jgi:hypothetical protein
MSFHTGPTSKNPIRRLSFSIVLCSLVLLTFPSVRPTPSAGAGPSQNPRAQNEAPRADKAKALSAGCCNQKTWAQKSTTGPSARSTALAYDQARARTVLFGGYTGALPGMDNQTWLWDGAVWTQATPATKPTARRSHNLAYDSDRQVTVLFGGEDITTTSLKQDTWEWDGTNWTQRSTTGPSPRQNYAMTYDSQRHVTILFGGQTTSSYKGDTWEWNGAAGTWSLKSNAGPSPRSSARIAYDPVRNVTVLFGGADNSGQKGDTWEWNGATSTWTQITPAGTTPSARASHGIAYDPSCGVVIFGGYSNVTGYTNNTWSWDGAAWTLRAGSAVPAARSNHGMAYDTGRNALVVFGGFFSSGPTFYYADTWEWSGGASGGADLWMKDTVAPDLPEDFGVEPTVSPLLYISRDIWVRDAADATVSGGTNPGPDTTSPSDRYYANEHQHQNPTYVNATTPSYLYVKVRNRGCASGAGTERLRVYWTKATASGSPWPSGWNEVDCAAGGAVDPCPLPVIAPGQDYVVQIPWVPPDPAAFGFDDHFCLLARIETQPTFPFGMTSPEGTADWQNVEDNNNIVSKNIAVLTSGSGKGHVVVRNRFRGQAALDLRFAVPAAELKNHFLLHGDIFVDLGRELMAKWRRGGQRARGFKVVGETTIQITNPADAVLAGLAFSASEEQVIEVRMQLRRGDNSRPGTSFNWDVIQMQPPARSAKPVAVGGMRYNLVVGGAAGLKGVRAR